MIPDDIGAIQVNNDSVPAVVISKMNTEVGSWSAHSFGTGKHDWMMLIAVYLAEGPVIVTNPTDHTRDAIIDANEWYKALSDLLFANMTLNGTVDILGSPDGKLFEYVTDNIIWESKQYYGHLFFVPVTQTIVQGVSA
jgi:tellurite resistance-related uncharacterized protein